MRNSLFVVWVGVRGRASACDRVMKWQRLWLSGMALRPRSAKSHHLTRRRGWWPIWLMLLHKAGQQCPVQLTEERTDVGPYQMGTASIQPAQILDGGPTKQVTRASRPSAHCVFYSTSSVLCTCTTPPPLCPAWTINSPGVITHIGRDTSKGDDWAENHRAEIENGVIRAEQRDKETERERGERKRQPATKHHWFNNPCVFVVLASARLRPIVSKPVRHLQHKGYKSPDITSISIWRRRRCFHTWRQGIKNMETARVLPERSCSLRSLGVFPWRGQAVSSSDTLINHHYCSWHTHTHDLRGGVAAVRVKRERERGEFEHDGDKIAGRKLLISRQWEGGVLCAHAMWDENKTGEPRSYFSPRGRICKLSLVL